MIASREDAVRFVRAVPTGTVNIAPGVNVPTAALPPPSAPPRPATLFAGPAPLAVPVPFQLGGFASPVNQGAGFVTPQAAPVVKPLPPPSYKTDPGYQATAAVVKAIPGGDVVVGAFDKLAGAFGLGGSRSILSLSDLQKTLADAAFLGGDVARQITDLWNKAHPDQPVDAQGNPVGPSKPAFGGLLSTGFTALKKAGGSTVSFFDDVVDGIKSAAADVGSFLQPVGAVAQAISNPGAAAAQVARLLGAPGGGISGGLQPLNFANVFAKPAAATQTIPVIPTSIMGQAAFATGPQLPSLGGGLSGGAGISRVETGRAPGYVVASTGKKLAVREVLSLARRYGFDQAAAWLGIAVQTLVLLYMQRQGKTHRRRGPHLNTIVKQCRKADGYRDRLRRALSSCGGHRSSHRHRRRPPFQTTGSTIARRHHARKRR